MKFVDKCIILIGALFLVAGITFAQQGDQPPSPPSASDVVSRMKEELSLTEEQISQITPIIQDELSQMQSFMEQGASSDTAKSKMDELRQSTESKLSQYLRQDQLTQWKNKQRQPPQKEGSRMESPVDL